MKISKSLASIILLLLIFFFSIYYFFTNPTPIETIISITGNHIEGNLIIEGETNLPNNSPLAIRLFDKNIDNSIKVLHTDNIFVEHGKYKYSYDISSYDFKKQKLYEFILGVEYNPIEKDRHTYENVGAQFSIDFSETTPNNKKVPQNINIEIEPISSWNEIQLKGTTNLPNDAVLQFILMPNEIIKEEIIETKLIVNDGAFKFLNKDIKENKTPQKLGYAIHFKFTDHNYSQPEKILSLFGNKGEQLQSNSSNISKLEDASFVYTKTGIFYWPSKIIYDDYIKNQEQEKIKSLLEKSISEHIIFKESPIDSFEILGLNFNHLKVITNNHWTYYSLKEKHTICETLLELLNSARKQAKLQYDKNARITVISIEGKKLVSTFSNSFKWIEE